MRYTIEFELPDNETVLDRVQAIPVQWGFLGFGGQAKAKPSAHAHWIHDFIDADWNCGVEIHCGWVCSNCNWFSEMESKTNYCPHCGAKMDEEVEGDNTFM